MMKVFAKLLNSAIFVKFLVIVGNAQQHQKSFEDNPYWHREIVDAEGKYQLEWRVDWSRENVEFNVTVETRGYVMLGLSRNERRENADIVVGGVAPNGKPYFTDQHTVGREELVLDSSQDWVLHLAWENSTHTFLSFSRPFDTCDEHDLPINDDTVYVLWAFGITDENPDQYSFEKEGHFLAYLRDPDITPRIVVESNQKVANGGGVNRKPTVDRIGDASRWTIYERFHIPPQRTTYWCNVRKFSLPSPGKRHIIGYNLKVNSDAIQNMQHAMLFRCNIPNAASVYEQFLGQPGQDCYDTNKALGPIPTHFCYDLKLGQAIGTPSTFLPAHAGVLVGELSQEEYYIFQVHYDNPDLRADIVSDIQLDIYYTSSLRENDAGILPLGQPFPGAPSILLPPGETDHNIYGHCSPSCTNKMLPPQGIKLFAGLFHTHLTGRRGKVRHFRNARELPWIWNDDNYKFEFQPMRLFRNEVTVLPGDQISVECNHNTMLTNKTTIGGFRSDQEMCQAYVFYYNKLVEYPVCFSEIMSKEYMMRYLAGTSNAKWNQSQLEFVATLPSHLAGMTLSSISDSPSLSWNAQLRAQLRRDHILYPQQTVCPSLEEAMAAAAIMSGATPPEDLVSFPVETLEYVPPQRCSL